jgi:membrane-associated phospholipid phosphatase
MPPLFAQDPLDALHLATQHRWLDVAVTAVAVACEPWAVALLALAFFSYLEREVPAVLKAVLPLAVALAAGGVLVLVGRATWAAPRLAGSGQGLALLRHVLPGRQALAVGSLVAYSLLAYGRRGAPALVLAALGAAARILAGPHWAADLSGGGLAGAALAAAAYLATARLFPDGHLARARAARRAAARGAGATGTPPLP